MVLIRNRQQLCKCSQDVVPLIHYLLFLCQFWSAYVPCDTQYKDAVRQTLEQIDVVHRMCEKYPDNFMFATSAQGETVIVASETFKRHLHSLPG